MLNRGVLHILRSFRVRIFAVVLFVSFFLAVFWTQGGQLILGHDAGYRIITEPFYLQLFSIWSEIVNFGVAKYHNPAAIPVHTIEYFSYLLVKDPHLTQRLVIAFWHVVNFSSFLFAYILYRDSGKKLSRVVFLLATFFYAVNFFNLQGWGVFWRTRFGIQVLLPPVLFYVVSLFAKETISIKHTIFLVCLMAVFNGGGSPPLYGSILLVWFATGGWLLTVHPNLKKMFWLFTKASALVIVGFFLLSAYWILPYGYYVYSSYQSQLQQVGVQGIVSWANMMSVNSSISNLFRLQGFPMFNEQTTREFILPYMINPFLIAISYLFPIGAFSAYFFAQNKKEQRLVILFYLMALLGLFFSGGTCPPFGYFYSFLLRYVPGFPIFRTPFFKFDMVITFSYAFLISFTLVKGGMRLFRSSRLISLMLLLIVGLWSLYHLPFFQGNFFVYNSPFKNKSTLPDYVYRMSKYINTQLPRDSRILLVPDVDKSNADGYAWGYWSLDPLSRMVLRPASISSAQKASKIVFDIYQALYQQNAKQFLELTGMSGIEYILFRNDTLNSSKVDDKEMKKVLQKTIEATPGITLLVHEGEWSLYKIQSPFYRPMVFSSNHTLITVPDATTFYEATKQDDLPTRAMLYVSKDSQNREALGGIHKIEIIPADCSGCDPDEIKSLVQKMTSLSPNILPDSPFYPIIRWNEQRQFYKVTQPQARIHALLMVNGRRVSEFVQLYQRDMQKTNVLIAQRLTQDIRDTTQKILDELSVLSGQEQSLYQQIILAHLLEINTSMQGIYSYIQDDKLRSIYSWVGQAIVYLEGTENDDEDSIYNVSIPESDSYIFQSSDASISAVIDGQTLYQKQSAILTGGTYQFRVHKIQNPAGDVFLSEKKISLKFKETEDIVVPIRAREAVAKLRYKISGSAVEMKISTQAYGSIIPYKNISLQPSDQWKDITVPVEAVYDVEALLFSFTPCCYSDVSTVLEIDRLEANSMTHPNIYFFRSVGQPEGHPPPEITYVTAGPTKHIVTVQNALSPYTLVLNKQFDPHWRASFVGNLSPSDDSVVVHAMANGFANGWIINRTGSYRVIIEYRPQALVYIGGWISFFSVVASSIVMLMYKKKS